MRVGGEGLGALKVEEGTRIEGEVVSKDEALSRYSVSGEVPR